MTDGIDAANQKIKALRDSMEHIYGVGFEVAPVGADDQRLKLVLEALESLATEIRSLRFER